MTFLELASGKNFPSSFKVMVGFKPRPHCLDNISASSREIAACGIFLTSSAYFIPPVCGVYMEAGPTERTKLAIAPCFAASDAPFTR